MGCGQLQVLALEWDGPAQVVEASKLLIKKKATK